MNCGIVCIDFEIGVICIYDELCGLQLVEFNFGVVYCGLSGCFYFGGVSGFNVFEVEDICSNEYVLLVVFILVCKLNQLIELDCLVWELEEFEFDYQDLVVMIGFVVFDYIVFYFNCYQYMLEGLQDEWIEFEDMMCVIFVKFSLGCYIFCLRVLNNEGVWNEDDVMLCMRVYLLIWCLMWVWIVYIVFGVGVIFYYVCQQVVKF